MSTTTPTKRCPKCGLTKPTSEFHHRYGTNKDGSQRYQPYCIPCSLVTRNKYKARLRARIKQLKEETW